MIRIDVDVQGAFRRKLSELEAKQLPFAAAQALNSVAFQAQRSVAAALASQLDRPTEFTKRSVLVSKASKSNLSAAVFIRDQAAGGNAPATYLQQQVMGGPRRRKAIENKLDAMGILPPGMFVVPGKNVPLDASGNVPRTQLQAILRALDNPTTKSRYFALSKPGQSLRQGIYQRAKAAGKRSARRAGLLVLLFVGKGKFRKRVDFFGVVDKVVTRKLPDAFKAELEKAVASAWSRAFK